MHSQQNQVQVLKEASLSHLILESRWGAFQMELGSASEAMVREAVSILFDKTM